MLDFGLPALFAIFVWWFSTGLVLYLDGLAPRTFRWSLAGATVLLALGVLAIAATRDERSVAGAYLAFSGAVLVWGWLEMAYFTGVVTGPRKAPCPPACSLWRRFRLGVETSLYHELAVIATACLLWAAFRDAHNQVAVFTFLILWGLRWSAKLNVFLGVRNLHEDWLPQHLHYLASYFGRSTVNLLFPISVTVATVLAVLLAQGAASEEAFERIGACLLTALMVLGILEHWFMVLPLSGDALWGWGIRSHRTRAAQQPATPDSALCRTRDSKHLDKTGPAPAAS